MTLHTISLAASHVLSTSASNSGIPSQAVPHSLSETVWHSIFAAIIAPLVGIALGAILYWADEGKPDALVQDMSGRCIEGIFGGFLEGFLVAYIFSRLLP